MDLLILVTHPGAGPLFEPLARACNRAGIEWSAFFTGEGVRLLCEPAVLDELGGAGRAVACLDSWRHCMGEDPCPVESGSQTDSSALAGRARRMVPL